jgi:Kef-type K+ transport system membrane component KefB
MNQVFTAASHHDVLVLLVQISVLLLTARLLGELAQRLGQPTVVGEILAGIILGPSLLSGFVPFINEWIVPQTPVQGLSLIHI